MSVLSTLKYTALRIVRGYIVLLLLLLLPILILTFFWLILSGAVDETGEPYFHQSALSMVLSFQLFGGSVVMHMIYQDFFTANKWRIYTLPFNKTLYAFSILMCGTAYSVMMGAALMTFTQFALGMEWNWLWTLCLISLMSVMSSIVCLIFTFSVNSYKLAERLSEIYGIGFIALAGLFFPLPDNAFFDFMGSYGNPLALSIGAVNEMKQGNPQQAWLQASILLAANVVLFIAMLLAGRRKIK
ncbi:multidrug ABC transporter permease [Cohnella hongkongensis]|uniref:Multidrug ABC transporter permease n=1 Tax=Cohnella hongkongensis TaxID=178337 RepID=A0ABV9F6N1_9BACL